MPKIAKSSVKKATIKTKKVTVTTKKPIKVIKKISTTEIKIKASIKRSQSTLKYHFYLLLEYRSNRYACDNEPLKYCCSLNLFAKLFS